MAGPVQIEKVLEDIRIEYKKILEGSHVSWNKQGMMLVLEKAISNACVKHLDAY